MYYNTEKCEKLGNFPLYSLFPYGNKMYAFTLSVPPPLHLCLIFTHRHSRSEGTMFLHRQSSHLLNRGENLSFTSPTTEMLHGGLGGHLLCLAGQAESTAGTEDTALYLLPWPWLRCSRTSRGIRQKCRRYLQQCMGNQTYSIGLWSIGAEESKTV